MRVVARGTQRRQVTGESTQVMTEILQDDVNLAVWQRHLPAQIEDFALLALSLGKPLADHRVIKVDEAQPLVLQGVLPGATDLQGHEGFCADVAWLVDAFACLLGARRVGLRLRVLDNPMCPRFHVDQVPVRLLCTYAGRGSEWLQAGAVDPECLASMPEPVDNIHRLQAGDVALLKGEKWLGNEGAGLIHRSPPSQAGERRLLLSLDWLA
ncbi:MAG TPA: DUF1826 domain-containing protein [Pseudomonas sp.]|uniref:DUF1826 domain-containing protein n=1 Tax=Pseudomonas sp. TaxID=306 RepID=UPI002B490042|nr:DUF1826 domain-containing protein [Pseudomonas sp.]HKS15082.1 DUF1826 domain-containing protein [Pseudomonas sp.]